MKASIFVVMSVFLLSAAGSLFAYTNQELSCDVAQVSCPAKAQMLESGVTESKPAMPGEVQLPCNLAQVNCPAKSNIPASSPMGTTANGQNRIQLSCQLAQIDCPARANTFE